MSQNLPPLTLAPRLEAAAQARSYIGEVAHRFGLSGATLETLELLTSELVTNAVIHARTPVVLTVTFAECITVEVRDHAPGQPEMSAPDVGGWGLRLVDRLSVRWGVSSADPGKIVWFELPRI